MGPSPAPYPGNNKDNLPPPPPPPKRPLAASLGQTGMESDVDFTAPGELLPEKARGFLDESIIPPGVHFVLVRAANKTVCVIHRKGSGWTRKVNEPVRRTDLVQIFFFKGMITQEFVVKMEGQAMEGQAMEGSAEQFLRFDPRKKQSLSPQTGTSNSAAREEITPPASQVFEPNSFAAAAIGMSTPVNSEGADIIDASELEDSGCSLEIPPPVRPNLSNNIPPPSGPGAIVVDSRVEVTEALAGKPSSLANLLIPPKDFDPDKPPVQRQPVQFPVQKNLGAPGPKSVTVITAAIGYPTKKPPVEVINPDDFSQGTEEVCPDVMSAEDKAALADDLFGPPESTSDDE